MKLHRDDNGNQSHACYPHSVADIYRGILLGLRDARLAVAPAPCPGEDVCAVSRASARHDVRSCAQGVLILLPGTAARVRQARFPLIVRGDGVAGILLAKLLDGQLACFVRAEGELFVVSVSGEERTVSREVWRLLPEQQAGQQDRVHHLHRQCHRGHSK